MTTQNYNTLKTRVPAKEKSFTGKNVLKPYVFALFSQREKTEFRKSRN